MYSFRRLINNTKKYGIGYIYRRVLERFRLFKKGTTQRYIESYYLKLTPEEREKELKDWFQGKVGYPLNLDYPTTFDEKIQWLKLYDSTPIKTKLSDKYLVRDWVEEQIGRQYLVPLLGVWDSFDEIDFSKLPNKFVLKANHGSAMNLIVTDKNKLNMSKAKAEIDGWFIKDYGVGPAQEWQYLNIPKKLIAEKYIDMGVEYPPDYKVFCFNGEPKYIQLIEGRNSEPRMAYYDLNWEKTSFTSVFHGKIVSEPLNHERPNQLQEMLTLSQKLSKGFAFVRIDWYLVGEENIYFGEMTFTPNLGIHQWIPPEADKMLGDLIKLPKEKYILSIKQNHEKG